ncbi:LytR C-terminal domain-containing protein [Candidatus Ruminimicrobium bovinum]|uniref:LytR C-terminal domain-containing protein n=1 Tax=Candidatus Ruminimicrobium bovinum TaxID=3242779 RepID=UPI0039B97C2B
MLKKILLIIFLIPVVLSCFLYYSLDEKYKNAKDLNILFVIEDDINQAKNTPIFLLAQYFPNKYKLQIIFINEQISILKRRTKTKTISQLYSEYEHDKRIISISKEFEELFDNSIKTDYFINIDKNTFKDFFKLFDKNIDQNLLNNITDKTNYYNYICSNMHLIKIVINNFDRTKIFDISMFIKHNVINTDIKPKFLLYLLNIKKPNIVFADIPTIKSKGRIEIDSKNKDKILQLLNDSYKNKSFLNDKIIVEVLNASNKKRLASKAANKLIENGFDVFNWTNSSSKTNNTIVIDLINNENVSKICKLFDCENVLLLPAPKNFADVTLLLGDDCNLSDKFDTISS